MRKLSPIDALLAKFVSINKKNLALMRGVTIIEMGIIVGISGVLLASMAEVARPYFVKKRLYDTQQSTNTIVGGLNKYFGTYGRYPCVASMSAAPGSPNFGVATDCTDQSVPPGTCNADYCVSIRSGQRVRIGSVPFRDMKNGMLDVARGFQLYAAPYPIGAGDTIDAYKNRFTYAVTEVQATDNYAQGRGAIRVHDEHNNILNDATSYVLVSHGKNRIGAHTFWGAATTPCAMATGRDRENCSMGWSFVDALRSDVSGAAYYDDTLVYRSWLHYYLWDVTPLNSAHIHNLNPGNVGIGTMNPTQKLHLKNGGIIATGNLLSDSLCDDAGNDCFATDIIGGTALPPCPRGQAMRGIDHSTSNCQQTLNANKSGICPPNKFATGFQYNTVTKHITILCNAP